MGMAKATNCLITVLIAISIGISALSFVPGRASASVSWESYASPSGPNQIYINQYPTFNFWIKNTGGVGLDIWNLYVHFDWATSTDYTLVGSTHVSIAAGVNSPVYHQVVHVPQTVTAGTHTADIYCTGQATGDWFSTSGHWIFTFTVNAVPTLVVSSIGANHNSGTAPLTVNFYPSLTGGLSPYSYSWTFGDGGTSTLNTPSHVYTTAGSFTAKVVVTDTETVDQIKSASATITVTWPPLSVTGIASKTSGTKPLSIDFTCSPSGGDGVYIYSWTFGDGGTSTSRNPSHTYSSVGSYAATVTVTSASQTAQWSSASITVSSTPLPGSLSVTGTASTTSGLAVSFTCTPTEGTSPYTYSWNFGDGSGTSNKQNPSHTYGSIGSYIVTVTVTDSASNTAQWTTTVILTGTSPPPQTSWMLIIGVIIGIAIIAVVVAFFAIARKKKAVVGPGVTLEIPDKRMYRFPHRKK